ncbi:MAG: UDP-N-acetylglucosamine 1-carboxyvinyltransferase [Acidimicrobiia bacterium]
MVSPLAPDAPSSAASAVPGAHAQGVGGEGAHGDVIVVRSRGPLEGTVAVGGAKNSVLKLMAACLLAPGNHTLRNVPRITDVGVMGRLVGELGVAGADGPPPADGTLHLVTALDITADAPAELCRRIRASIVVLGPLLARCGEAVVTLPGGDDFGVRPIDLHIRALEAMGARFEVRGELIRATAPSLHGASITLDFPSVGATENIVLAATLAKGTTVLDNAAREPEIVDLCEFLVAMGADITGIGSSTIVVHGVDRDSLRPVHHTVVPDRVEAATYLAAVGVTGGDVVVEGARADHMEMLLHKLRATGMEVDACDGGVRVRVDRRLTSVDVATLPYPGVATDYKPLLTAMLATASGTSIVTENLFAGRFKYVDELALMGADIRTDAHRAVVRGVARLRGAEVVAHDIRAGAALVVAALAADGDTLLHGAGHVDRGYDDLVGKLRSLGADISR